MKHKFNLIIDLIIIVLSIFLAVKLAGSESFKGFLHGLHSLSLLGSFIAGIFFTSIFTVAPAVVILAEFADFESVFLVSIFGGLGALLGDWLIFNFVKDRLSGDLNFLLQKTKMDRLRAIFRLKLFRHIFVFLGALIVASPLPDEIGLLLMGLSRMKARTFVPLSLILNTLGILAITSFAKYL